MLCKLMVVDHVLERAGNHDVLKMFGTVESSHANRQLLPDSEMPRLPSHFVAHANQPARDPGHGALLRAARRVLMRVNAAREVKDPLSRGANLGG